MSETKGKWLLALVVALIVLQIVTLVRLDRINEQMQNLEIRVANLDGEIRNSFDNVSADLQQQLEQEASLIDSYSYELGELDADNLTMTVDFSVSPKQLAADSTASLELQGKSFHMQRQGDSFVATVEAELFETIESPKLVLETGGLRQQETLDRGFDPSYDLLPRLYAWLEREGGSTSFDAGENGNATYYLGGEVQIDLITKTSMGRAVDLSGLCLLAELDGAELWRLEQADFPRGNQAGARSDGQMIFVQLDPALEFALAPGQSLAVYAQAEDEYGLIHRVLLGQVVLDESGEPNWDMNGLLMGEETLLDKNGKLLWQPQYL